MSKPPFVGFERLRQLAAKYWQPLALAIASMVAVWGGLQKLELPTSWLIGLIVGLIALIFVLSRFPRLSVAITRLLLGRPRPPANLPSIFRGPRPYGSAEALPGRQREIDDCWRQLREERFFILEGESGCGKSSLLNAALIPKARATFRVVTCRVADDPFGQVCAALRQVPYRKGADAVQTRALADAMAMAVQANAGADGDHSEAALPPLLCLDQFEELFVTVREDVRQRFLAALKEAIEDGRLQLLIVLRSDFRDLLDRLCRMVDPRQDALNLGSYYVLQAFRAEQAEAVLGEMLEPVHGNDPILHQQLEDFAKALVGELLRPPRDKRLYQDDDKTVLPVELQTVGMMLESMGSRHFSGSRLRRLGGKAGLLRAYIEDAKTYVWHKTGVSSDRALVILRQLISDAQTKWTKTAQSIAADLATPSDQVAQVLEAFADKYLVNRLPAEEGEDQAGNGASSPRYELMHEHLVQILGEAPDPMLEKIRDAEQRLRFWTDRTRATLGPGMNARPPSFLGRLRASFVQPIPILETLRLWRFARSDAERRMLARSLRGFALKMAPLVLIPASAAYFVGWPLFQEGGRARANIGALHVQNLTGATLSLKRIRHHRDEKSYPPGGISSEGEVIDLPGPADYLLTARKGEAWTVQYPVYIHGYQHRVRVTVQPPPRDTPEGMLYIPGGIFRMGDKEDGGHADEKPAHDVDVDGFFMDRNEATNADYQRFIAAGSYQLREVWTDEGWRWRQRLEVQAPEGWGTGTVGAPDDPVVSVSWYEADAYCRWVGKRLPTEAEWEKAARGPEGYLYAYGHDFDPTNMNREKGYGLSRMTGGVWEWVADWYDAKTYQEDSSRTAPRRNPTGPASGEHRILRGGSSQAAADFARTSFRGWHYPPDYASKTAGFRCMKPLPPPEMTSEAVRSGL